MAIGYSKIISQYNDDYFENWISFAKKNFVLFEGNSSKVYIVNNNGVLNLIEINDAKSMFETSYLIIMKFRNNLGNAITCTVNVIHKYLVVEEYSMDELLTEEEYDELYNLLLIRFQKISIDKKLRGFIFDSEGYSEDYINIDLLK
jgi:hypothetical protein